MHWSKADRRIPLEQDGWTDADSDRWEQKLVGTLILTPYTIEFVGDLRPEDFRLRYAGGMFATIRSLNARMGTKWEAELLLRELARDGKKPPAGWSWLDVITAVCENIFLEDENLRQVARDIQGAHLLRRSRARSKELAHRV